MGMAGCRLLLSLSVLSCCPFLASSSIAGAVALALIMSGRASMRIALRLQRWSAGRPAS